MAEQDIQESDHEESDVPEDLPPSQPPKSSQINGRLVFSLYIPLFLTSIFLSIYFFNLSTRPLFVPTHPIPPILYMAPFFTGGGFGNEATTMIQSIYLDTPIRPQNLSLKIEHHGDLIDYTFLKYLRNTPEGDLLLPRLYTPLDPERSMVICHSEPGAWNLPAPLFPTNPCPPPQTNFAYKIGRSMFETDRIPSGWVARLNQMDAVWVPTAFHMATYASQGVDPRKLRIVPEAVNVTLFDPESTVPLDLPAPLARPDVTLFCSVFKWEPRKGWDALLRAFARMALRRGNATEAALLLKTSARSDGRPTQAIAQEYLARVWEEEAARLPEGTPRPQGPPRLEFLTSVLRPGDIPRLYKACNVLVQPSRGEGWGRPHLEGMAMGLPVIATNWSGNTAFMTERNSYLLRVERFVHAAPPFHRHLWADPDVEHLAELMGRVLADPDEARQKGAQARRDVLAHYTLEHLQHAMLTELERAGAEMHRRAQPRPAHQEL
eukprot:gnl/Trimastix_PCT/1437.p1 GENE.gnl/Trimastix_PCT/1437~~gnl/Trimastix_PCT/1437.p1  ORF type:complete len:507 (-),score=116.34 gnl/Trimastix_PCT/1437:595-2070(-)